MIFAKPYLRATCPFPTVFYPYPLNMSNAWTYHALSVHFSPKFGQVHPGRLIRRFAVAGSLIPGRDVSDQEVEDDHEPFENQRVRLIAELKSQFAESAKFESIIRVNLAGLGYSHSKRIQ